jgi:hypothetical protein
MNWSILNRTAALELRANKPLSMPTQKQQMAYLSMIECSFEGAGRRKKIEIEENAMSKQKQLKLIKERNFRLRDETCASCIM